MSKSKALIQSMAAALLLFALSTSAAPARAQLPDGCTELGLGLTEHTCFHARFGPFAEVAATAGNEVIPSTPNIDAVHTHFRVTLSAGAGVVRYTPKRSGAWAVFHDPDIALELLAPDGSELAPLLEHQIESCPYLPRVRVYELTQDVQYRYLFGPSPASQVVVVNEKVDDFIAVASADADGDGYGDANGGTVTACTPVAGQVLDDSDCDDTDPDIHPGKRESCDGVDENCNLIVDDIGEACFSGTGPCRAQGTWSCPAPDAPVVCSATALDAAEIESCNAIDDDCDGIVDDGADALCASSLDRPRCVSSGNAKFCGCERDADCGGPNSGAICFLRANEQRCVDGCILQAGRNGCPDGLICTSTDPSVPGMCTSECQDDVDCTQLDGLPRCSTAPGAFGVCVECTLDLDCSGRDDGKVRCIGHGGTCAECSTTDKSACTAEGSGAACLFDGRCGCNSSSDCADGRSCDTAASACLDVQTNEPKDAGPAVDAATDGGLGPDEPMADAQTEDPADSGVPSDRADGGVDEIDMDASVQIRRDCGCRVVGERRAGPTPRLGFFGCLLATGWVLRRRKRFGVVATLVVATLTASVASGCSRSYLADDSLGAAGTVAGGGAPHDHDHGHDHDAHIHDPEPVDASNPVADASQDGAASQPDASLPADGGIVAPICIDELGDKLVMHSCQHVDVGPLSPVAASDDPRAMPEDVSKSHTGYSVAMPGETGRVSYRPSRDGMHVVMVSPSANVRVVDAETQTSVSIVHEQPIDACPGTLDHGAVVDLRSGHSYRLVFEAQGAPQLNVFVEHGDTFGRDAWKPCEDAAP